jgi:hypothetical protein
MTDAREITVEEIDEFEHWVCQIYAKAKRAKAICALARRALSQESGLTADEMMGVGKFDPEPYPPSVSVERERETQRLDICASCGQPFRSCKCFNAPDTPQSVPTCTCSKHPLWDGYDGDCPIHGWFEPVAPDTPQSVPATEKRDTDAKTTIRSNRDEHNPDSSSAPAAMVAALAPDAPLSQGEDEGLRVLEYLRVRKLSVIDDDRLASLIAERDKLAKGYQAAIDHAAQLVERVSVLEGALEEYAAMGDDLGDLARAALRTSEER